VSNKNHVIYSYREYVAALPVEMLEIHSRAVLQKTLLKSISCVLKIKFFMSYGRTDIGTVMTAVAQSIHQPRHQGGAHGGRAPAKIVRAPAKITGLVMFHLGCQIKILVFVGIFILALIVNACFHSQFVSNGSWSFLDIFL